MPKEVYFLADYNIAIGSQPHSEIAALAIFLDRIFEGNQFNKSFLDEKMKIIPSDKGKNVIQRNQGQSSSSNNNYKNNNNSNPKKRIKIKR